MNVSVENLAPCKKLLRVELDAAAVDLVFDSVTKDIQKQAILPGFRPGKAPRDIVVKKYSAEINEEAKRKLVGDNFRKAVEEKHLHVIGSPDIEEVQLERGQPLQFTATIETAPEFELPEYKGLPAQLEAKAVTDADVDRALELLREQQAAYETVARPLANGDVAVVNYTGTSEGKPITEIAPTAMGLTEQKNFWVDTGENSFIPGFAAQLIGAQAGEKRTIKVDFPADFVTSQLQGKQGVYEAELLEVKAKVLPAMDDALAKKFDAENLEKLKAGVRVDLENELKHSRSKAVRAQTVRALLGRVNFDLPETAVAAETRNAVYNIVHQNTQRGINRETIEQQKDEIYSAAAVNAKERVKLAFIVQRIAEKEKITVTQADALQRAQQLAAMYQMPLEQFLKDLQKRNGAAELYDQVLHEKVLGLIEQSAVISEGAPSK